MTDSTKKKEGLTPVRPTPEIEGLTPIPADPRTKA